MTESQKPTAPRTIKVAAGVLLLEALAPLSLVIGQVVDIVTGKALLLSAAFALLALWLGATLWISFAAKRLVEGRGWARSTAIFWQLVQLAVASASFTGKSANYWIGGALILTALVTGALIFSKQALVYFAVERDK